MLKNLWENLLASNTLKLGLATILGAAAAYFGGQMGGQEAVVFALTGVLQILQRLRSLEKGASPAAEK